MINSSIIIGKIQDNLESILSTYKIDFIILYGSHVNPGQQTHPESDIDITVRLQRGSFPEITDYSTDPRVKLSVMIDNILGVDCVHVALWKDLPPYLKFEIFKHGVPIFMKDKIEYQTEMELAMKMYWDHKIWYDNIISQKSRYN